MKDLRKLEVDLEIHTPGLDVDPDLWSLHQAFIDEIENHFIQVAASTWGAYQKYGRGGIFVENRQGLKFSYAELGMNGETFFGKYLTAEGVSSMVEAGSAVPSLRQVLGDYDPENQVVIFVTHCGYALTSCYLFSCDPQPPECYQMQNYAE